MSFGVVMLYSASYPYALRASQCQGDPYWFVWRQIKWLAIGLAAMMFAAKVDYAIWRKLAVPLWGLAFVLLVAVLIPGVGYRINGARRWLPPGFQPSELSKLAVIVGLAWCLERWQKEAEGISFLNILRLKQRFSHLLRGFAVPMLTMGLVSVLILAEPDVGTSVLVGVVGFCVMLTAGVRWWLLTPCYGGAAYGVYQYLVHDPVRWERIIAFTNLEKYKDGAGLQQYQAMLAFGSGGLWGVGLGHSRAKELYLPLASSDFIAPIIGEEWGLVGMLGLLLAFAVLVALGIHVARHARDPFGSLLAIGVVSLIGFQALINLAVVTAWMPNKGMPLPFISYGGSNLCVLLCSVGVLMSVARHAGAPEPMWAMSARKVEFG
ncbi:MAG: cell division protein FtsW [Verrucomicrobia bacterium]|nr:cell division protein FtsW [Verrucomicrobiota bacterium]